MHEQYRRPPGLITILPDVAGLMPHDGINKKLLAEHRQSIIHENEEILVAQPPEATITHDYVIDPYVTSVMPETTYGRYNVFDKKTGLPNYSLRYQRQQDEACITAVHVWDYSLLPTDLQPGETFFLQTQETKIIQPVSLGNYSGTKQITRSKLEFTDPPSAFLYGMGYAYPDGDKIFPYDKSCEMTVEEVKKEIALVPGLEYVSGLA
jgi:hypothetical protein